MDSHRLEPDHAPTPFTAEEIRDASPDGWTVDTVTRRDGDVIARARTTFRDPGSHTTVVSHQDLDADGNPVGALDTRRVSWTGLQRHASFPAAVTTVTQERLVHPLGELDCLRYDVRGEDGVATFWFAPAYPGMPVRYRVGPDDAPEVTEVVAVREDGGS